LSDHYFSCVVFFCIRFAFRFYCLKFFSDLQLFIIFDIRIFYYFLLTDTCSLANCTKHVYVNYINKLTIKSWWYSILARSCLQSFPTYQHICYHLYKGSGRSFLHIQFQVNPTSLKINYQLFNLWFLFSLIRMVLKDLFEISASLNFFHGMALA